MAPPQNDATPEIFGRYILLDKLGEGGMGRVDRAIQCGAMGFNKTVAIKRLRAGVDDEKARKVLLQEARLGGQLKHPNIVETYDFGEVNGTFFLCMEFVDGITLDRLLSAWQSEDLRLPLPVVIDIFSAICEGLDYAHHARDGSGQPLRVVHRDLKPANIIVSRNGVTQVMDFGIARTQMHQTTTAAVSKGTPLYMSPEQIEGSSDIDSRSDLFALGAILYELCTGKRLFEAESVANLMFRVLKGDVGEQMDELDALLPGLGAVCVRCLAKDPQERWQSAAVLRGAVDELRPSGWSQQPGLLDLVRLLTDAFESGDSSGEHLEALAAAPEDSGWPAVARALERSRGRSDSPLALPRSPVYSEAQLESLVSRAESVDQEPTEVVARPSFATTAGLALLALLAIAAAVVLLLPPADDRLAQEEAVVAKAAVAPDTTVVVAGRRFLESSIMVELFATMIEETSPSALRVERKFHLAELQTSFSALIADHDDVDVYTDYTGGLMIFELNEPRSRQIVLANHTPQWINDRLARQSESPPIEVLDRLGFENGWAITMLRSRARELGVLGEDGRGTLSSLAEVSRKEKITYMTTTKHASERGVYEALVQGYGVEYSSAGTLRHEQKYDWLRLGRMDVTDGFETDPGLVFNPDEFVVLEDDQRNLSYYYAVPVARKSSLERHPELRGIFARLAGRISERDMASLLRAARARSIESVVLPYDEKAQSALQRLVRDFLVEKAILDTGEIPAPTR